MGQMIKSDTEERKVEEHYDRYFAEGPNWPSAFWEWVRGRGGQGRRQSLHPLPGQEDLKMNPTPVFPTAG